MKKAALLGLAVILASGVALAAEEQHKDFVGNVASIDRQARTVVVENATETKTFALEPSVTLRDETGDKTIELADLKIGDHVKVVYHEAEGKLMASKLKRMPMKQASNMPEKKK